jgi:GH24 family phage-related lysozyme (muramidase)
MKVSAKLIEMIKHDEGVRVKPYRCPALLWTVGVGHVIDQNHIRVPLASALALT